MADLLGIVAGFRRHSRFGGIGGVYNRYVFNAQCRLRHQRFADRDFDGAVERTKNRPFAQGRVKKKEALLLTAFLCLLAALCLIPLNHLTWLMSLPALFLALTYPFTKRFFPIPQLYLGLAFSFGIPMAFAAVGNSVPVEAWILLPPMFYGHWLTTLFTPWRTKKTI